MRTKLIALLMVCIMGFGLVAAAPVLATHDGPNINPTADADEWDGDDTDEVDNFAASDDESSNVTYETEDDEISEDDLEDVVLNVTYDGVEHVEYDLDDADVSNEDTADEGAHVEFEVEHSDLETLPGEATENTTANVTIAEHDDDGDVIDSSVMEFEVDFTFANERTVMFIDDDDHGALDVDEVEPSFLATWVPFVGDTDPVDDMTIEDELTIAGDETNVTVFLDDGDVDDSFSDAAEDFAGSGDAVLGMTVLVDGDLVPVFNDEVDGDIADEDDTHAIYDGNEVEIHLSDDFEDEESVDVEIASQNPLDHDVDRDEVGELYSDLGFMTLRSEFGLWNAFRM